MLKILARPARLERATCGFVVNTSEFPNLLKVRKYLKSLNVTFTNFHAFWKDLARFRNFFSHKFSHKISSGHVKLIRLFRSGKRAKLGFPCILFFGDDSSEVPVLASFTPLLKYLLLLFISRTLNRFWSLNLNQSLMPFFLNAQVWSHALNRVRSLLVWKVSQNLIPLL
jgi:hypothetical protein